MIKMPINSAKKINQGDLKYLITSLALIVFLLGVIGYALFFLVGKSWQLVGFPKKNIPVDNTRFDLNKLDQFKTSFPQFGK